jgi:hypothetical protein
MNQPIVCPVDGKDDQIQKITAAVSDTSKVLLNARLARPIATPINPPLYSPPNVTDFYGGIIWLVTSFLSLGAIVGPIFLLLGFLGYSQSISRLDEQHS